MSKTAYLICFMVQALLYVPVYFSISPRVSMIAPCSYVAYLTVTKTLATASGGNWIALSGFIAECLSYLLLSIYCGAFYLGARLSFGFTETFRSGAATALLQLLILVGIFCCSLIKIIHSDSFAHAPGTYDFWQALSLFLARH